MRYPGEFLGTSGTHISYKGRGALWPVLFLRQDPGAAGERGGRGGMRDPVPQLPADDHILSSGLRFPYQVHTQHAASGVGAQCEAGKQTGACVPQDHQGKAFVLSVRAGHGKGGRDFDIPHNRQELAEYLCVDRSAMSSELSKMRAEGILDFQKNHFVLHDRGAGERREGA